MKIHLSPVLAISAALALSGVAAAQEASKDSTAPAATAKPPADGRGMMGSGGAGMMGGGGMMGHGMMGGGMMGGGMPMAGMMYHADGYLAFLKAELKITDAQATQWNAFADAERANAKAMREMMAAMVANRGLGTFPERLELHEKLMAARLDELRKEKGAADALYGVLSDEQKKTADELLSRSMGMM